MFCFQGYLNTSLSTCLVPSFQKPGEAAGSHPCSLGGVLCITAQFEPGRGGPDPGSEELSRPPPRHSHPSPRSSRLRGRGKERAGRAAPEDGPCRSWGWRGPHGLSGPSCRAGGIAGPCGRRLLPGRCRRAGSGLGLCPARRALGGRGGGARTASGPRRLGPSSGCKKGRLGQVPPPAGAPRSGAVPPQRRASAQRPWRRMWRRRAPRRGRGPGPC